MLATTATAQQGDKQITHSLGEESTASVTSAAVTGSLVDPSGSPISNGVVHVYDRGNHQLIERTTADGGGQFSLSSTYSDVIVVATDPTNGWFHAWNLNSLSGSATFTLYKQLLFGPEVAYTDADEPLGVVSVWRWALPGNEQRLKIEVTNTNLLIDEPSYQIDHAYDLSSGLFSITFPENVAEVDYGTYDAVDSSGNGAEVLTAHTPETVVNEFTEYHPENPDAPGTPLHAALSHHGELSTVSTTDLEAADKISEGVGRVASAVPVLGTAMTWVDTIIWGYGDPLSKNAILGESSLDTPDPNETETVSLGWKSDNAAVFYDETVAVFDVPIRLLDDQGGTFTFQAEWHIESGIGFGAASGSFSEDIYVGPIDVPPVVGSASPTDPDGDGLYEDVDGDGQVDDADVETLADHIDDPEVRGRPAEFDFNGNGRVDYADVVRLSEET